MPKSIWKYQLETTDVQEIEMPKGAEIISIQTQAGIPCIWAIVNTITEEKEKRKLKIIGTGQVFPDMLSIKLKYIGTYQLHSGTVVFHCFEFYI